MRIGRPFVAGAGSDVVVAVSVMAVVAVSVAVSTVVAVMSVVAVSVTTVSVAMVSTMAGAGSVVSNDPATGGASVEEVSATGDTTGAGSRAAAFGAAGGSGEVGGAFFPLAAGFRDAVFVDFFGVEREGIGAAPVVVPMRADRITERVSGARMPACVATNARDSAAG